jgi:regulator of cell morphogenesis and NO signaling
MFHEMINRKITDLVEQNYVNGYVLHYFGINFFQYFSKTLEEVCAEKGIDPIYLIRELSLQHDEKQAAVESKIGEHPIDLIIAYLKHAHFRFIKRKLPYLAALVEQVNDRTLTRKALFDDLKLLFPLFAEDFIKHIYEEEDTLFEYLQVLLNFQKGHRNMLTVFRLMDGFSMEAFSKEHAHHENEMEGIRLLTEDYKADEGDDLGQKVLMYELSVFHQELDRHAEVENNLLFPKALSLEKEVREYLGYLSRVN